MPNTPFFISPAYSVPPIRISFSVKLTAITVSLRQPWRAGIGLEAGQVDDRVFGHEAGQLVRRRAHQQRADEQAVPGQLGDHAHVDAVFGLRAAEQVGDVELVLVLPARRGNRP